jgi:hypothetical protein
MYGFLARRRVDLPLSPADLRNSTAYADRALAGSKWRNAIATW